MEINNKNSRKEYKFLLTEKEIYKLKIFYGELLVPLFPNRTIESLYMDTVNLEIYKLSKNTDVNKFKLRFRLIQKTIRKYTKKLNQINRLEKKRRV